jgi:hypothetical protein
MAQWTADDLLKEVFAACRFPATGTVDYTPAVIYRRATDAIWNWATHQVATARDGRMAAFLTRDVATQTITSDGSEFELPPMAVADSLDSVTWQSADGGAPLRLQLIPLGQEGLYNEDSGQGVPSFYLLLDGRVRVLPAPRSGGKIKITYLRRHGQIVPASDQNTAAITNLTNVGGPQLTLSAPSFVFQVGQWVDIVSKFYPYRFKLHGARITAVNSGSSTITLGAEAFADVNLLSPIGDIVCLYGVTRFVHLPLEMRVSLTKRIAMDILNEIGDVPLAQRYEAFAEGEAARSRDMLSPRVKSDREKVISRNSVARSGARVRRGWRV